MVLNFLFEGIVFISVVLVIALIYNLYNFITKRFSSSKSTEKGIEKIGEYKRRARTMAILLILSIIFILLYTRPISFNRMIRIDDGNKIISAYIWGKTTGGDHISVDGVEIEKLQDILSSYKYRRTFGYDDLRAEAVYLFTDMTVVEVYQNGYVRIPNYSIYKIDSKEKDEIFNKLVQEIEKLK